MSTTICSPARLLANQKNSAKSTGPETPDGKDRSRPNALKHGLTGEGIALPSEDRAEVDSLIESMRRDFKPRCDLADYFLRRVATMTFRVERCVRQETAILSTKVRHAVADFDDQRAAEIEAAFRNLADDPANLIRKLLRSPEGVDCMIEAWLGIKEDLGREEPLHRRIEHIEMAENLLGRTLGDLPVSPFKILIEALSGNFRFLDNPDAADRDPSGTKEKARKQLFTMIDARIKHLRAHRETIDLEAIELDRAEAADRALFDSSKEATLARKYEANAERNLFKALKELREVNAEAEEANAQGESEPDEVEEIEEIEQPRSKVCFPNLGSFVPASLEPSEEAPTGPSNSANMGSPGPISTS